MTAYGYLRKSSTYGSTDPEAATQEREVRALAARHGDDDLIVLSDMDISGSGRYTKQRAGYQALAEAVRSSAASAVYSYSLSRLGRSVPELSGFIDLCRTKGVTVRLVVDNVDVSSASGRMNANMLASVAQFEAEVTGERVKARIALKRANGERVGAPPFGSKRGENLPAVLRAFAEAGSYRGAAKLLNKRRIRPRHAMHWGGSSVKAIVTKADPTIRAPKRGARVRGSFTLSRLLICGTCRTPLTGTRQWDRRKPDKPIARTIYECSRGHALPHPKRSVHEGAILPAVIAEATKYRPPSQDEQHGDDARRAELEAKRERIISLYVEGVIDKPERERRLRPVNDALHKLSAAYVITWLVPRLSASDFGRYSPRGLNRILRALWGAIELDPTTYRPARFDVRDDPHAEYALAQRDAEEECIRASTPSGAIS